MQQPNSSSQSQTQGQGKYPVSDHDYNIITALSNELEGLEKYHLYASQAQGDQMWQDALKLKRQLADLLTHELAEHAAKGHFGSGQPRNMR